MIPGGLRAAVEARLGRILDAQPVGGGSINHAARVRTADGPVFIKYHPRSPAGMFAAEARGLDALRRAAAGLVVPRVLARADAQEGVPAWLALEWLEPAVADEERLGRGLAALHRTPVSGWGWEEANFIGSLPQANDAEPSWAAFWRLRRMEPQLKLARRSGRLPATENEWARLLDLLPGLLAAAEDDGPSLLHGDLWSGNVLATAAGPALIDPAVYRGHREVDLAMAELFGGVGARFRAAYREAWPLAPGYAERRAVYQLYYLLAHVNLFGGGYVPQTASVLRTVS
ncbi:fructosamine kinase family protein [Longimicrobium terrae]|uniref:Fructosamine-3-kinase n=1 Tax=Longimicrobium terrae TaxID=1639882 RepID=A0A841H0Q5_9BACT|nr:fructosamine kinase family protein [Longimicrobium terrae]MBB4637203.1 fructosamine-3-kinase [Longimicrobium terrae]MBB6071536.1 fructosamine-3-kinase [Longimicrobium terrae]NNC30044.1 phosphotransferase [Longimicrobium terrae]